MFFIIHKHLLLFSHQILRYELPLVKYAYSQKNIGFECDAKLTYIIPNKLQPIRFFKGKVCFSFSIKNALFQINPGLRPPEKNVIPGTVIDSGVTHPTLTQFYLNSHIAIQVLCYLVLYVSEIFKGNCTHSLLHRDFG